jgi:hypothetical protein
MAPRYRLRWFAISMTPTGDRSCTARSPDRMFLRTVAYAVSAENAERFSGSAAADAIVKSA